MIAINLPDFELPENCDCCDLMKVEGNFAELICPFEPFGVNIISGTAKPENCPLIDLRLNEAET